MAVQTPTAADFKARYPEFAAVSDTLIGLQIAEASNFLDEDWRDVDQKPAIMSLVAHLLTIEGYPDRLNGGSVFDPGLSHRSMKSRSVGDVSVSYGDGSGAGGSGGSGSLLSTLDTTVYGQRFAQYMKLNVPTIGLV